MCSALEAVIIEPDCGGIGDIDAIEWEGGCILGVGCTTTLVPISKGVFCKIKIIHC